MKKVSNETKSILFRLVDKSSVVTVCHIQGKDYKTTQHTNLRASPTPGMVMLFPRRIELLQTLPWAAAPTVKIHGLKEEILLGDGPVFPAACTTNIPTFTAASKAMSIGLK